MFVICPCTPTVEDPIPIVADFFFLSLRWVFFDMDFIVFSLDLSPFRLQYSSVVRFSLYMLWSTSVGDAVGPKENFWWKRYAL